MFWQYQWLKHGNSPTRLLRATSGATIDRLISGLTGWQWSRLATIASGRSKGRPLRGAVPQLLIAGPPRLSASAIFARTRSGLPNKQTRSGAEIGRAHV